MQTRYHIIKSLAELRKLISACKKLGYACVDFETNAEPIYNHSFKPTIVSITFMPGFGCSIPLDHFETKDYTEPGWNWKKMLKLFGREVIENPNIVKMSWNGKFDFQIFERYNIYLRGPMLDGMLAKYLLNEERPNGLKDMVDRYIPEASGYEADKGFDKIPWDQKPLEPLCKYGCQDTDYTFRLMIFFEKKLIDNGLYSLYRNLIMPASRVLQAVEKNGLYLDREFNQKLLEEYKPKIEQALENIYTLPKMVKLQKKYTQKRIDAYIEKIEGELSKLNPDDPKDTRKIASREQKITNVRAGVFSNKTERELVRRINLNSNNDIKWLMYSEEGFNFPILKYTDSGAPSADEETLVELRMQVNKPDSPKAIFLDNLLALRGLEKMYKTYIDGWSEKVQDDHCLHGQFKIHGCVTGDTLLVGSKKDIRIDSICPKEVGVKNIENQDIWILSHEGTWEQITHTINKGNLPTYRVVTTEGKELRCTKDHKLLTPLGMKRVSYIYRHNLPIIMHDVSRLNIEHLKTGKSSKEVIYREIPNFRGYLASNEGKIYSVKVPGSRGVLDYNHPHELVPRLVNGRYRIYLRNSTKKKYAFSVSRLIWETFKGVIPKGFVIDHIDCNPTNNILENLQCITHSDNIRRAYVLTRKAYTNGGINGSTVTNTQDVGSILYEYSQGYTQQQLVDKYGISKKQVNRIINKKAWKYIYLSHVEKFEYLGELPIYDLSVNDKHSYVTRSNFINSNTTSGRLSSAEPNLQQIPKTSVDPNIKKQLIARPGTLYMAMDFSQAELRIMAHLSGDKTYLTAFREGQDPHLAIAAKKYGVPYEEALAAMDDENHPDHKLWKTRRKQAKQIAFGIIYGIQAKLLAQKLSDVKAGLIVTPQEAQQSLNEFFQEHPKIKKFMQKQEKLLRKQGYVSSLFGRKRRLPQIYSDDSGEAAYAVRLAVNMPCLLPSSQALCKTKGWVNYENLSVGDEILAFNSITGKSEWQPVLEVHSPDYDGYMYNFSSKHCGISSTNYHRWYISNYNDYTKAIEKRNIQDDKILKFNELRNKIISEYNNGKNLLQVSKELDISYARCRRIYSGKCSQPFPEKLVEPFRILTSEEMYDKNRNFIIPISSEHLNSNKNSFEDSFIAILGWYLTDSSIRNGRVKIIQSDTANHLKVLHIDNILKNYSGLYKRSVRFTEYGTVVNWNLSKDFSSKLIDILPDKKLTMAFISELTKPQLEILLYNMRLGDGIRLFCTADKEQASLMQAIVVLLGKSSSMFVNSRPGDISYFKDRKPSKTGQEYVLHKTETYGIKFSDRKTIHTHSYGKSLIHRFRYNGKVWCPTVQSGAFFVRYKSNIDGRYRTMITGNCQSAASDMCLFGSVLLYWMMRQGKLPKMPSVTLVHDANYFNPKPQDINLWVVYQMWDIFRNPSTKEYFGFSIDDVDMSMDFGIGRSMAEELPFIPGYDYTKMLEPDFSVEEYMEEHKKYKGIEIKDYPKLFPKEFKAYETYYKRS